MSLCRRGAVRSDLKEARGPEHVVPTSATAAQDRGGGLPALGRAGVKHTAPVPSRRGQVGAERPKPRGKAHEAEAHG